MRKNGFEIDEIGKRLVHYYGTRKKLNIPEGIEFLASRCLFNQREIESISLPEGVLVVGSYSLHRCKKLSEIHLPDSLEKIGEKAFGNCNIQQLTIPPHTSHICNSAFEGCSNLESIRIQDGEADLEIQDYAFTDCKSLKSVVLINRITDIGTAAFSYCTSLEKIFLPDSITRIAKKAFFWCSSLKTVMIPESVLYIGEQAFGNCDALTEIHIPRRCMYDPSAFPEGCRVIRMTT